MEKIEDSKRWRIMAWIPFGLAFLTLQDQSNWNFEQRNAYYALLIAGIGIGLHAQGVNERAIEIYNKDLKRKLNPGVTFNYQF